jgi:hypothetical protein
MPTPETGGFEARHFKLLFAVPALQSHKCDAVHLRGHNSNHDRPLGVVLDWVPEASSVLSRRPVAAVLETKRLGSGVVQRAVVCVLAAVDRALSVADVQGGVEERLEGPVSKDSVRSCLSSGARGCGSDVRAHGSRLLSAHALDLSWLAGRVAGRVTLHSGPSSSRRRMRLTAPSGKR